MVDLSVIIVNYNTASLIEKAVKLLLESARGLAIQICVVDNASKDNSVDLIKEKLPNVELIINTENVGFGRANNQVLNRVRGKYILLLNTDAFVSHDTISKTLAYIESDEKCGVLGVRLVGRDGLLQPSCRYFPTPWNTFVFRMGMERIFPSIKLVDDMKWSHDSIRECDWVPGCYYLIRREVIDQVGLFDPRFFLYFEEVDHCKTVKAAGWKVVYYSETTVVHIGGESAKSESPLTNVGQQISKLQLESELLYVRKHFKLLGLWQLLILSTMSDLWLAFKLIIRERNAFIPNVHLGELRARWRLLFSTTYATQPTR